MAGSATVLAGARAPALPKLLALAALASLGRAEAFMQQAAARDARVHAYHASAAGATSSASAVRPAPPLLPRATVPPKAAEPERWRAAAAAACLGLLVAFAAPPEASARLGGAAVKKALALAKATQAARTTNTKALIVSNMIRETQKTADAKAGGKKANAEAKGWHA